jgi:tol-pal system protein YbgF
MRARAVAPILAATLLLGCDRDAEERQLALMTEQIDRLQVQRDQEDRAVLETEAADTHFSEVPARKPAPAEAPPPAFDLGDGPAPADDDAAGDTEDPTPRPSIRVIGSGRGGRSDDPSSTVDDTSAPGARPGGLDPAAKPAYEHALSLVQSRQYDRALDELAAFLMKWPDHPYADNAMYWRGECYLARGDYLHAAEQFEGVVTRFPAGNKAPDALLKLGVAQQKLGNPVRAKEMFDRLQQTYPHSQAARHIPPVTVPAVTPPGPGSEDHR